MAYRGRADGIEYARRVNAAAELLRAGLPVTGAAGALSDRFGVSPRQARRYLEQAMAAGPIDLPEPNVVFTVKLPGSLADQIRAHARAGRATISAVVARALAEFLDRDTTGKPDGR